MWAKTRGKDNKDEETDEEFRSILDYYRKCRGLTITELAERAGLKRQMVSEMCDGEKIKLKYIEQLANALYVEEEDLNQDWYPEEMMRNRVRIRNLRKNSKKNEKDKEDGKEDGLTEKIDRVIDKVKPRELEGKARWIGAYLATEDKETQEIVDYVLCHANTMGLLTLHQHLLENFGKPSGELPDLPKPYGKANRKKYEAAVREVENMTNLAIYMKYRNKNIDQVKDGTDLSRQTIGAVRSGKKNLSDKNMRKIAAYLYVDDDDLTDEARRPLCIPLEREKIHAVINVCRPHNLERKLEHVCCWLKDWDKYRHPDYQIVTGILEFLLSETDEEKRRAMAEGLLEIRNKPVVRKYLHRDRISVVEVGYQKCEDCEEAYQAFVMFEPWMYEFFGLTEHVQQVKAKSMEGQGGDEKPVIYRVTEMPIFISTKGREFHTKEDLEGAVLDAVSEYMREQYVTEGQEQLYRRFLEECLEEELNGCRMGQFTDDDSLQQLCERRIRNITYEQVLKKLYQDIVGQSGADGSMESLELFMFTAAELFGGIVSRPEEEKESLYAYLK